MLQYKVVEQQEDDDGCHSNPSPEEKLVLIKRERETEINNN